MYCTRRGWTFAVFSTYSSSSGALPGSKARRSEINCRRKNCRANFQNPSRTPGQISLGHWLFTTRTGSPMQMLLRCSPSLVRGWPHSLLCFEIEEWVCCSVEAFGCLAFLVHSSTHLVMVVVTHGTHRRVLLLHFSHISPTPALFPYCCCTRWLRGAAYGVDGVLKGYLPL